MWSSQLQMDLEDYRDKNRIQNGRIIMGTKFLNRSGTIGEPIKVIIKAPFINGCLLMMT